MVGTLTCPAWLASLTGPRNLNAMNAPSDALTTSSPCALTSVGGCEHGELESSSNFGFDIAVRLHVVLIGPVSATSNTWASPHASGCTARKRTVAVPVAGRSS